MERALLQLSKLDLVEAGASCRRRGSCGLGESRRVLCLVGISLFPLFCDNQSAIRIARGNVLTNASKHLKLRHIRVPQKQKQLFFCDTKSQQADAFTKSLGEAIYGMMVFLEEA